MIVLFMILFLLLLIIQIVCLIKYVRTKNIKNYFSLFDIFVSSIVSSILFYIYCYSRYEKMGFEVVIYILLCFVFNVIYIGILLRGLIVKKVETKKQEQLINYEGKADEKLLCKVNIIPSIIMMLISLGICLIDNITYNVQSYKDTKNNELEKMVNFINNKYNIDFTVNDAIYYREEEHVEYDAMFYYVDYYIPYTSVFKKNNKKITVVDIDGKLADDGQLSEINYFIADYFSKIVGIDIEFVEVAGISEDDENSIGEFLQHSFSEKITENNIDKFISTLLLEEDLELTFYIKDSDNRLELINLFTDKLNYLKGYKNIKSLELYLFNRSEDLIVNYVEKDFAKDHNYDNDTEEDDEEFRFGYYYVPNDYNRINSFVAYVRYIRGLDPGGKNESELINDWILTIY